MLEKKILDKCALSFDDVMLIPHYSEVLSRGNVSLDVELTKEIKLNFPVFPANMKSLMGFNMIEKMYEYGALSLMHRFMDYQDIFTFANKIKTSFFEESFSYIGFSVGVKKEDRLLVNNLVNLGVKILCIDVAHGDHKLCHDMIKYINVNYPHVFLIAGNVATYTGAYNLFNCGADAVKINIGAGSTCSTRIETGNGIPMVTALLEANRAREDFQKQSIKKVFIISDGACRQVGDICKALCLSDLVMTGNMFAGTDETPEELVDFQGLKYKKYAGSSTHKNSRVEGVSAMVPYKGPVKSVMLKMQEGIQSCCSYQGVDKVTDLQEISQFVRITNAGLIESHPHDVRIIK